MNKAPSTPPDPNTDPVHVGELVANGVPVGEPDDTRIAQVRARDLASEHAGLQAAREDLAVHALETGDPQVNRALGDLTTQQVAVRAEMQDNGVTPGTQRGSSHE